jgi:hypothetical protein
VFWLGKLKISVSSTDQTLPKLCMVRIEIQREYGQARYWFLAIVLSDCKCLLHRAVLVSIKLEVYTLDEKGLRPILALLKNLRINSGSSLELCPEAVFR